MEAIKIIGDVTSDSITIKNLSKYKGKKVEVIILPFEEEREIVKRKPKKVFGLLHEYANPALIKKKKTLGQ